MATLYKPYISDSSDYETDSDGYNSEESFAKTPGKFVPSEPLKKSVVDEITSLATKPMQGSGTTLDMEESRNTSLFMINSRDRDNRVYPQPTRFNIRLPHVYKNVKNVNITQINLLNSFFNFSDTNGNLNMYVKEEGRSPVNVKMRQGTYGVNELVVELQSAMNSTPLFASIDFPTFLQNFQTSGDFSPLFNVPGPSVYNSLTQSYEYGKTINDIVSRYFQNLQQVGFIYFTLNQSYVAYYYPIVKEMTIQNLPFSYVNQTVPQGFLSWYDYIVFGFQGLSDPYITKIVLDAGNQALFTKFHYANSFNASLVNQYDCSYNPKQGRLTINSPSLNQSIVKDLTTQYNQILASLVYANGYKSVSDFNAQYATSVNSNGVLLGFYNFIQSKFGESFGVNFGQYSLDYYANSNNPITVYNIINKYGWAPSLTPQIAESVITTVPQVQQAPVLWDNIQFLSTNRNKYKYPFISTINVPDSSVTNGALVFPTSGNASYGYIDLQFAINPTSYVQTSFKSRIRQSISLMTLPRYSIKKSSNTDMTYKLNSTDTPFLFQSNNILTDETSPNFSLYTVYQSMFNSELFMQNNNEWLKYLYSQILSGKPQSPYTPFAQQSQNPTFYKNPPINDISIRSYRPYFFVQVNADKYLLDASARFEISFYVETQTGQNFNTPIRISWYKDRAGFMADVNTVMNGGTESGRHYFMQTDGDTINKPSIKMNVTVNNSQITYFIIRAIQPNTLTQAPLRIFCTLTNEYGTYTKKTLEDTYDMPFSSLSSIYDQYTPASSKFQYPLQTIYDSNVFKLGYDSNGISNNLTDYYIQAGNNNYYDPINARYVMNTTKAATTPPPQISTPWSLYFGSNASFIRDLSTNTIYLSTNIDLFPSNNQNEFSLVNWFSSDNQDFSKPLERFKQPRTISTGTTFLPCVNPGNTLSTDIVPNVSQGYDISGFSGIGFYLPPKEYLTMQSIVLKFAYTQPNVNYSRIRAPPSTIVNESFLNAVSFAQTSNSPADSWDDWYVSNRRNTKLGIFLAKNIDRKPQSEINIFSSICTLTLEKITQINNYKEAPGTLKTREPDWGTFYKYTFDTQQRTVWDVSSTAVSTIWFSTQTFADFAPTFIQGFSTYTNVFETLPLENYTYLPRPFGVATAIANSTIQSVADYENSYVAVPFYRNPVTNKWLVGNFKGITYTNEPCLPSSDLLGASPYYGPPGGRYWYIDNSNSLYSDKSFYYWNAKVTFHNLEINYDPATDLKAFGEAEGLSAEYQDTFLFAYSNQLSSIQDTLYVDTQSGLFPVGYNKWGRESSKNYIAFDDQSGYNYLSYIHDMPMQPGVTYRVNVRAYDPIPKFFTGLRIIGKNTTDFGTPTFAQIAQEISSIVYPANNSPSYVHISDTLAASYVTSLQQTPPNNTAYIQQITTNTFARDNALSLSYEYADSLINFNASFSTTQTFGKTQTYAGVTYIMNNYEDAIQQYSTIYNKIIPPYQLSLNILSTATGQLNSYANTKYAGVLPSYALNRNKITDPLPFQLLLSSYINPTYAKLYDSWGLGYNLGFNKADTPPQPRTIVVADTFIRIVQDYIYLKINPELNMNKLAISNKENLADTHDPSAEDSKYFSKILLNDFASYCRTAVQQPVQFNPPLGKLDTISFQLLDKNGVPINNVDCEYDVVLEITEIQYVQKDNSSLLKPELLATATAATGTTAGTTAGTTTGTTAGTTTGTTTAEGKINAK